MCAAGAEIRQGGGGARTLCGSQRAFCCSKHLYNISYFELMSVCRDCSMLFKLQKLISISVLAKLSNWSREELSLH